MIDYSSHIIGELTSLIFRNCSLEDLLDRIETLIYNPVVFAPLDSTETRYKSKGFPSDDIVYHENDLELEAHHQYYMDSFVMRDEPTPFYSSGAPGLKYRHIICWVKRKSSILGRIAIPEIRIPNSDIDPKLIMFICECIAFVYTSTRPEQSNDDNQLLAQLLSGQIVTSSQITSMYPNISISGSFRLICFPMRVSTAEQNAKSLLNLIKDAFNSCYGTLFSTYLIILFSENHHTYEHLLSKLKSFNTFNQSCCCVSERFYALTEVRSQFLHLQFLPAFKHAKELEIIRYEDHPECNIIFASHLSSSELMRSYAPELTTIEQYDKQNNTQYLDTLRCYLNSNKNTAQTSSELFVHPNTIVYRLKRIRELFSLDLEKSDILYRLLFSFKLTGYIS